MDFIKMRDFFFDCPILDQKKPISLGHTEAQPINYGYDLLPPEELVQYRSVGGDETWRVGLTIYPVLETITEQQREANMLQIYGFFDWVNEQSDAGIYPESGPSETVINMYAANPMRLGYESGTTVGMYSCQCYIEYVKEAT